MVNKVSGELPGFFCMIKIDLPIAIAAYLFILIIGFLIIWLVSDYARKGKTDSGKKNYMWQCSVCTHVYTTDKEQDISRCPNCRSYNKRKGG